MVSYRLGERDGVSTEAETWIRVFRSLGFDAVRVAGSGSAERVVPGLGLDADRAVRPDDLAGALKDAGLVVVENVCSLPLNLAAGRAVAAALRGRPAILRHHDLPWQRPGMATPESWPPDDPAWRHVTINDVSRRELAERGISATTITNGFDTEAAPGRRAKTRRTLRIASDERVVLQPTRAIARKNVRGGLAITQGINAMGIHAMGINAMGIGATYWLFGPAEEGYDDELASILAGAGVRTILGRPETVTPADAYAAADAVVLPSTWEGFGNPAIEAAIHRKPLAIGDYPVARELAAHGFRWFPADDAAPLAAFLERPDPGLLDHNQAIARRDFSLAVLERKLRHLLDEAGWLP